MKKYLYKKILLLIVLQSAFLLSQEKKVNEEITGSKIIYEKVNELKSGNWKDVLTDFMQLSFKNLAGESKSFQYKTSLFSIKSKVDSSLLVDYNYSKETFSRNFQVNVGLALDNDYKFKGFNYGLDWALINKRDLSVAKISKKLDSIFINSQKELQNAVNKYEINLKERGKSDSEIETLVDNMNNLIAKGQYIPRDNLPNDFLSLLSVEYKKKSKEFKEKFNDEIDKIKLQPLLTIGFNGAFQKDSEFLEDYTINMVYLQGIRSKKSNIEIDFRNRFQVKDSIVSSVFKRKEFSSQLGLNISVMKIKEKSIIEFKPNFEYKRIFTGLMEEEKNNQFLANADLRIRVLNNLWIPLVLKYDVVNNNLFGFLNVSFNFDAIKKE